MKARLVVGVLAVVVTLSVCAVADLDEVLYQGTLYCVGQDNCQAFATWGGTAAGYVELLEPGGGSVSDYIWVDFTGQLWFESKDANGNFGALPPAGLPLLGTLIENGTLQEVDQFFPGGVTRPLFVESPSVPEPSTLWLFGPAAIFLFNRARRFRRN
jgi:PEP-CTERM motif